MNWHKARGVGLEALRRFSFRQPVETSARLVDPSSEKTSEIRLLSQTHNPNPCLATLSELIKKPRAYRSGDLAYACHVSGCFLGLGLQTPGVEGPGCKAMRFRISFKTM